MEVRDATKPLVFFATVGTFNQKDKEEGNRLDLTRARSTPPKTVDVGRPASDG